jgi:hypothetical protein
MVRLKAGLSSACIVIFSLLTWPAVAHHWRSSDVGANYSELEKLLIEKKWEQADFATKTLIFEISRRNQQAAIGRDWLTQAGVENFPCRDLQTIDRMWRQHSQGRYGFSVQLRLWDTSLEPDKLQAEPERWRRFRKHLGWYPREDKEFKPEIEGRLPEPVRSTPDFGDGALLEDTTMFSGAAWLRRSQQCDLPPAQVSPQALNWQTTQTATQP